MAAAAAAFRAGIERRIDRASGSGVASLSGEQLAMFRDANGEFRRDIPASELYPFPWFPNSFNPALG